MHYFCNVFICSMVVELGAPKPIGLYVCYSMFYEIINPAIPHKNDTQIGFKPNFNEISPS